MKTANETIIPAIKYCDWNIEAMTGYVPQTTFYMDFSLAEPFGSSAIRGTLRRAKAAWKNNVVYMTELTMALNWKIWEHYGRKGYHAKYAALYDELWTEMDAWCKDHFSGEDLAYYYRTVD